MKKEYIRATHNFDNSSREWTYRGDRGQEKFEEWRNAEMDGLNSKIESTWSLGVHALERDQWMDMQWIVHETIRGFRGDAGDNYREFEQFLKDNPNYKEIIQQHIENDFKLLVKLDMVQVREREFENDFKLLAEQ